MTAQPLSKKSRDELNISLNILYRKFVKKSDPGSKEENSPVTNETLDSNEEEEQENQLSAAVGIGI